MREVGELYRGGFFKKRGNLNWRINPVCAAIQNTFPVFHGLKGKRNIQIIDAGCATGDFVAEFNRLGYNAWGIEGSIAAKPFFVTDRIIIADLRKELLFQDAKGFDVCYSLEVAEHIEEEYADQFIDNLCFLSNNILITAAPPGQGGHGHYNCQPKEYWIEKFNKKNYRNDTVLEMVFQTNIEKFKNKRGMNSYYNNCMVFRRT